MSAQGQCDQPHALRDKRRSSPTSASRSYPQDMSSVASSHIGLDISSPDSISDPETLALKSSLMLDYPSASLSSLPQPEDESPAISNLDSIDMPSNIMSFGAHCNVAPDFTHPQVITHEDRARIISLERQVCQNYNCCGVPLADFHALMNHFDMSHVSVVAPNGKRIFPPVKPANSGSSTSHSTPPSPSCSATSSASSRSSSVESSPRPSTPITPGHLLLDPVSLPIPDVSLAYSPYSGLALSFGSTESSPNHPCPYSYDVISAFGPEYDFTKDYACYERAYAEKLARKRMEEQREREEKQREIERLEREFYAATLESSPTLAGSDVSDDSGCCSPSLPYSTSASDTPMDSPVALSPTEANPLKKSKVRKDGSVSNNGGKVPKSKVKSAGAGGALNPLSSAGRKREKTFRCPHGGCTKSYLNPNGLKYHLEKGTCKFDDADNSGAGSSSESSPSSPTEPNPSFMSAKHEIVGSASLFPAASASDVPTSSPPSSQHSANPSPPAPSYGPFPPTMRPHQGFQTLVQAAGVPSSSPLAQSERGSLSTTIRAVTAPQRTSSAPSPVSGQIHPVESSSSLATPASRPSAAAYSHLGQGQVVFSGAASSSL